MTYDREAVSLSRGRWKYILESLGVNEKYLVNRHGPCPMCGGKDRFRFDDNLIGQWICNRCGSGNGFTMVKMMFGMKFHECCDWIESRSGINTIENYTTNRDEDRRKNKIRISSILYESEMLTGECPASKYILNRCGYIDLSVVFDIRFNKSVTHCGDSSIRLPCMIGIIRKPDDSIVGLHRTYITDDGHKADVSPQKAILASDGINGSSIRIGKHSKRCHVSEGVETSICANKIFNCGGYSAMSATGMEKWQCAGGVSEVVIAGDNDVSYTGQASAYALARRLVKDGINCEVHIPCNPGEDWADVCIKQTKQQGFPAKLGGNYGIWI